MKTATKQDVVLAKLTIPNADKISLERRKQIAMWLRRHADELLTETPNYAKNFTARIYE